MKGNNQLAQTGRILSIDAFRGITILVMIFVNEVAGVRDIPLWLKHMPADADAMTFVDVVFPAFLFIVGMSIPFALQQRRQKGDGFWQIQLHIFWRSLALIVMGVFMVNAEQGVHEGATGLPRRWWSLLFYISAILVWNVYRFKKKWPAYLLRGIGVAGLIILAWIYRSGADGTVRMQPHWWGILGLIGWAYLYSCIIYQLSKGRLPVLILFVALCTAFYAMVHSSGWPLWAWVKGQAGHAAHTAIVLCGVVLSLLFFSREDKIRKHAFASAAAFAALLALAAYVLRPFYSISKIYATPSWCFYSAASCCVVFSLLYWLTDIKGIKSWTALFRPAATNPLLIYILPGIWYGLLGVTGITVFPWSLRFGWRGILWAAAFAAGMMLLVKLLNRSGIRLRV